MIDSFKIKIPINTSNNTHHKAIYKTKINKQKMNYLKITILININDIYNHTI